MIFIVNNLPTILCLLAGIALVVAEMFLPGFGVPGITGIRRVFGAVLFTWVNYGALAGSLMALGVIILIAVAVILSFRSAARGRLSRSALFLKQEEQDGGQLPPPVEPGREGVVQTPLRPAGTAVFDGQRVSVLSEGAYIAAGEHVRVVKVDGPSITVEKL